MTSVLLCLRVSCHHGHCIFRQKHNHWVSLKTDCMKSALDWMQNDAVLCSLVDPHALSAISDCYFYYWSSQSLCWRECHTACTFLTLSHNLSSMFSTNSTYQYDDVALDLKVWKLRKPFCHVRPSVDKRSFRTCTRRWRTRHPLQLTQKAASCYFLGTDREWHVHVPTRKSSIQMNRLQDCKRTFTSGNKYVSGKIFCLVVKDLLSYGGFQNIKETMTETTSLGYIPLLFGALFDMMR